MIISSHNMLRSINKFLFVLYMIFWKQNMLYFFLEKTLHIKHTLYKKRKSNNKNAIFKILEKEKENLLKNALYHRVTIYD